MAFDAAGELHLRRVGFRQRKDAEENLAKTHDGHEFCGLITISSRSSIIHKVYDQNITTHQRSYALQRKVPNATLIS